MTRNRRTNHFSQRQWAHSVPLSRPSGPGLGTRPKASSGEQPNRRRSSVAWRARLPRNGSRVANAFRASVTWVGDASFQAGAFWLGRFPPSEAGTPYPADPLSVSSVSLWPFRGVFSFKFSVFSGEQPNRRRSSVAWRPRLPWNGSRIGNRESGIENAFRASVTWVGDTSFHAGALWLGRFPPTEAGTPYPADPISVSSVSL
jgi:hypothetical protein